MMVEFASGSEEFVLLKHYQISIKTILKNLSIFIKNHNFKIKYSNWKKDLKCTSYYH